MYASCIALCKYYPTQCHERQENVLLCPDWAPCVTYMRQKAI